MKKLEKLDTKKFKQISKNHFKIIKGGLSMSVYATGSGAGPLTYDDGGGAQQDWSDKDDN